MTTAVSTANATATAAERREITSNAFRCLGRDGRPLAGDGGVLVEPVLHDRVLRGANLVEPAHRPVRRLDEVRAAKHPIVKYGFDEHAAVAGERPPVAAEAPKGV